MPIYEYHCEDCGKEFEKLMSFSDPNVNTPECPACKSNHTRKRLSTVAAFSNRSGSSTGSSGCGSAGGFG